MDRGYFGVSLRLNFMNFIHLFKDFNHVEGYTYKIEIKGFFNRYKKPIKEEMFLLEKNLNSPLEVIVVRKVGFIKLWSIKIKGRG